MKLTCNEIRVAGFGAGAYIVLDANKSIQPRFHTKHGCSKTPMLISNGTHN